MTYQEQLHPLLRQCNAVIFDMDGVVTDTARTHAKAWKRLFDQYLRGRARQDGIQFVPFDISSDYLRYVDGKPRYDGVQSFLTSRGITLPVGRPDDAPGRDTVCGLGNRKNVLFLETMKRDGVRAFPSTVNLIKALKASDIQVAVISASRNCRDVLEAAHVRSLFDVIVDGADAEELGLPGKPDPAIFLEAARRLGVKPNRAAVVEDSLAGVEAASRGGFRMVIGVDRQRIQAEDMQRRGAHRVVRDLSEMIVDGSGFPC